MDNPKHFDFEMAFKTGKRVETHLHVTERVESATASGVCCIYCHTIKGTKCRGRLISLTGSYCKHHIVCVLQKWTVDFDLSLWRCAIHRIHQFVIFLPKISGCFLGVGVFFWVKSCQELCCQRWPVYCLWGSVLGSHNWAAGSFFVPPVEHPNLLCV